MVALRSVVRGLSGTCLLYALVGTAAQAQVPEWCSGATVLPRCMPGGSNQTIFIIPTTAPRGWVIPSDRLTKIKDAVEERGVLPSSSAFAGKVMTLLYLRAIEVQSSGSDAQNRRWQHRFQNGRDYTLVLDCPARPGDQPMFSFSVEGAQSYIDFFKC